MDYTNSTALASEKLGQMIGTTRLIDTLGFGSYGCLFLGLTQSTGEYVAVKMLSKRGLDAHQLDLQRREAEIHSILYHPNIVSLYSALEDDDYLYLIMELCSEGDLYDLIVRELNENGACDEDFIRSAFFQTVDAVEYLHSKNVYHRDIKPENIMRTDKGVYKLGDFGLATRDDTSTEFGTGSAVYLSPEHFDQYAFSYSPAAGDVWALGILLLALITGHNPWKEASLSDPAFAAYVQQPNVLRESLPISDEVYDLLTRVLCLDPNQRMTVSELNRAVRGIQHFRPKGVSPMAIPAALKEQKYDGSYDGRHSVDSGLVLWDELEGDLDFSGDPFIGNKQIAESPDKESEDEGVYSDEELFINSSEKDSWWR